MAELNRTYTGPAGAQAGYIQNLANQVTSEVRNRPVVEQQMGEELMQKEGVIPALSEERGKLVEQLFNADQQFTQKYGSPESQYYIEDPMARQSLIQGQQGSLWGSLAQNTEMIRARKAVLGDTLQKGLAVLDAGTKARQLEFDNLTKLFSVLGGGAGATKQKATQIIDPKQRGVLMTMEVMFNQLAQKSAGKALGKWQGGIANKALEILGPESNQFLRELKEYKDLRYGLASQIARAIAGESGVLNEADIQRALNLLPDIYDVAQSRANKLASLRQFMDSKWESALSSDYTGEQIPGMPEHLAVKLAYTYNPMYSEGYGGAYGNTGGTLTSAVGGNDWILAE